MASFQRHAVFQALAASPVVVHRESVQSSRWYSKGGRNGLPKRLDSEQRSIIDRVSPKGLDSTNAQPRGPKI